MYSNLVVLCSKHHTQVHHKNLEIKGYKNTENGVELDYRFIDKDEYENKRKNRLKYNSQDIEIIKQYEDKPMNYIIKKLREEHNISISRNTLNRIYSGNYGI